MISGDNAELTKRYSEQFRHAIDCAEPHRLTLRRQHYVEVASSRKCT